MGGRGAGRGTVQTGWSLHGTCGTTAKNGGNPSAPNPFSAPCGTTAGRGGDLTELILLDGLTFPDARVWMKALLAAQRGGDTTASTPAADRVGEVTEVASGGRLFRVEG